MGRDALLAGDPAEGLWFLRHAVQIDGDDAVCWQLMGRCFEMIGEKRRAARCYQIAIRQYAESDDGDLHLGKGPLGILPRPPQPHDA
jgi:Tfp pilus assembly protein PilF